MAAFLLSDVLVEGRVDGERICAALRLYLVANVAFGSDTCLTDRPL
jgi:hypothetical protein